MRGSGLTRKSRANAQVLSLESKAEALRRLGCGDGGVVLRGDSNCDTSATTASFRFVSSNHSIQFLQHVARSPCWPNRRSHRCTVGADVSHSSQPLRPVCNSCIMLTQAVTAQTQRLHAWLILHRRHVVSTAVTYSLQKCATYINVAPW